MIITVYQLAISLKIVDKKRFPVQPFTMLSSSDVVVEINKKEAQKRFDAVF